MRFFQDRILFAQHLSSKLNPWRGAVIIWFDTARSLWKTVAVKWAQRLCF